MIDERVTKNISEPFFQELKRSQPNRVEFIFGIFYEQCTMKNIFCPCRFHASFPNYHGENTFLSLLWLQYAPNLYMVMPSIIFLVPSKAIPPHTYPKFCGDLIVTVHRVTRDTQKYSNRVVSFHLFCYLGSSQSLGERPAAQKQFLRYT